MSADGGDDFVRRRVCFCIEDCADALQILRRKIVGKFPTKNMYNRGIFHILDDSSVRDKYNRRVFLIVITVFGQRGAYQEIKLVVELCHTCSAIENFTFLP